MRSPRGDKKLSTNARLHGISVKLAGESSVFGVILPDRKHNRGVLKGCVFGHELRGLRLPVLFLGTIEGAQRVRFAVLLRCQLARGRQRGTENIRMPGYELDSAGSSF